MCNSGKEALMTKKDWFWGCVGLLLVAVCLYTSYELVILFIKKLSALNHNISAAIIGAMATIIGGILVVTISQSQARKRAVEESHRSKKVEIYKEFLEIVSRMMASENEQVSIKAPTEKELIKYMVGFKSDLILWGSPKVIKAQLDFESASVKKMAVIQAANNLYLAIREDIGLSNRGLTNYELIKMYLKDPSEIDEML